VCSSFADKFYSACKDDEIYWIRSDTCRVIKELYDDGKEFIQTAFGSNIEYNDEDDNCFNSADVASVSVIILLLSLVFLFI